MSSYNSNLFARDACSDAFGPGAANAICNPSGTLCCVRFGQAFPACEQYLGKGWCCVGSANTDNCYVDQASSCNEVDAVACSQLAAGTTKACCPRLTTCADNVNASLANVRCNIQRGDLLQLAETSSSSSSSSIARATTTSSTSTSSLTTISSSSSASSIPTSTSSSTTSAASSVSSSMSSSNVYTFSIPTPTDSLTSPTAVPSGSLSSTISNGVLAGIIVGPVLAFILAVVLAYLLIRRCMRRRRSNLAEEPISLVASPGNKAKFRYGGAIDIRAELPHKNPTSELSAINPRSELSATRSRRHISAFELSST